ncbi:MAG TPA: RNA polymerase sigma factor [Kofleriaceae bacterium]|nr:RNA polymerase sigma factor [Kofleriaceae bacterium]
MAVAIAGSPPAPGVPRDGQREEEPAARARVWAEHRLAEHAQALRLAAVNRCRNTWEADDLVQETFARALRHLAQGHPAPVHMRSWLHSILRNAFVDHVRRVRSRAVALEPVAEHAAPEREPEPVWAHVSLDDVRAALARLDGELRRAFELHYLRGMRYKAVAAKLGVPENTVASRLFRARKALRRQLARALASER